MTVPSDNSIQIHPNYLLPRLENALTVATTEKIQCLALIDQLRTELEQERTERQRVQQELDTLRQATTEDGTD